MSKLGLIVILFILFIVSSAPAEDPPGGTAALGGLSGFLFLPESKILDVGDLMFQGRLELLDTEVYSDPFFKLPINVTWGAVKHLELGCEIPFYPDDPSDGNNFLGDITLSCGYLYETARGGSSLTVRGNLRLPSGEEERDRGSELEVGAATATTFRLFRLHTAGSFVIAGGHDPFDGDMNDFLRFSTGGSSYICENIRLTAGMRGETTGFAGMNGSVTYYGIDRIAIFGTAEIGLSGGENFLLAGGVSWIGSGF